MMRNEKAELLKQQIREAFVDVPYPNQDNSVDPYCSECVDCDKAFKGKHWLDITMAEVNITYSACLWHFGMEEYLFYLPAYLLLSIDFNDDARWDIAQSLTIYFDVTSERYIEYLKSFNSAKRKVVINYFEFIAEEHNENDFDDKEYVALIDSLRRFWAE